MADSSSSAFKKHIENVTKEIFLNAMVCPKLGWLIRSEKIPIFPSLGDTFRTIQGNEIEKRARLLYPEGLLIKERDTLLASNKTRDVINNTKMPVIFQATFSKKHYVARADMLKRNGNQWALIEVKSAVKDKKEFIDDMAYTLMVIEECGLRISTITLLLVSKNYRLGMDSEKFFESVDHTNEVRNRKENFKQFWTIIENITKRPIRPEGNPLFECKKCKLLKECLEKEIEGTIFQLPRLTKPKFEKLTKLGIVNIEDIPNDFPLTGYQEIVKICHETGKPYVSDKLKQELTTIRWPAFYLDFETIMTAVPLYSNVAPYTKIPTQYSIHKCSKPGEVLFHREFISEPKQDSRKKLTEHLVQDLEQEGSIIVYSDFEQTIIHNLSKTFPEYSNYLEELAGRLVDLEKIIRYNFYHPEFHGSTSIKKTLPALVPGMSYDSLKIADGDTAMATYVFMALGSYEGNDVKTLQEKLLKYCEMDTLATVKLHQELLKYAQAQ